MQEFKIQIPDGFVYLERDSIPLFPQQPWGAVFPGIYQKTQNVIIKSTFIIQPANSNENPEREKKILEEINALASSERIFMKLLCYIKTEKEHLFILERAKMDLFTFLQKTKLKTSSAVNICKLIARLTNRLHQLGYTHCDISPENLVIYVIIASNGKPKTNIAFIDAAQVQKLDFSLEFDVNVKGKPHEFDNRKPGKEDYQLPQCDFGEPFSLRKADIFAAKIIMWLVIVGTPPFLLDLKNKKNIKPIEDRANFFNSSFDTLISPKRKEELQSIWMNFSNFLSSSVEDFNLNHPLFKIK